MYSLISKKNFLLITPSLTLPICYNNSDKNQIQNMLVISVHIELNCHHNYVYNFQNNVMYLTKLLV